MYSMNCRLDIMNDKSGTIIAFGFYKQDCMQILINMLKLKFGKMNKLRFSDTISGNEIVVKNLNDRYCLDIGCHTVISDKNNEELIVSFLLDCTEKTVAYNHIDFCLIGEHTFDITFYMIDGNDTVLN